VGGTEGYHTVLKLEKNAQQTVRDALGLLKAEKVSSGKYTVVMDPKMCGVFAHEAFGHLSEADHISENAKLKKMMTLGRRFGSNDLSILDDATIEGQRGHYYYDEEGVASHQNYLIKNGILVGRLHSRQTAGRMNERPPAAPGPSATSSGPSSGWAAPTSSPGTAASRR